MAQLTDRNDSKELNLMLRTVYNQFDDRRIKAVYPEDLADEVFRQLDPERVTQKLIAHAATLELRQLARHICAQHQQEMEHRAESGQIELFQLQERYPAMRSEGNEPPREAYVLRESMTYPERMANVDRLLKEAVAKRRHANALRAETMQLVEDGLLTVEPADLAGGLGGDNERAN